MAIATLAFSVLAVLAFGLVGDGFNSTHRHHRNFGASEDAVPVVGYHGVEDVREHVLHRCDAADLGDPRGYDDPATLAYASARPIGYRSAPNTAGVIRHGPMNPGPLADDVAGTFRSGTYDAVTSAEPTSLYRVFSDPARQLGPYWTRTRPSGPVQSVIDNALDPACGIRATSWTRGLVGGGNQVFLPWVDDAWAVRSGGF